VGFFPPLQSRGAAHSPPHPAYKFQFIKAGQAVLKLLQLVNSVNYCSNSLFATKLSHSAVIVRHLTKTRHALVVYLQDIATMLCCFGAKE
jgi:hypothetical protein